MEHVAAGGVVSDEDRRLTLPKMLPKDLAEDLLLEMSGPGSLRGRGARLAGPRLILQHRRLLRGSCSGRGRRRGRGWGRD